jgi:hypothetical protein
VTVEFAAFELPSILQVLFSEVVHSGPFDPLAVPSTVVVVAVRKNILELLLF